MMLQEGFQILEEAGEAGRHGSIVQSRAGSMHSMMH
jgi:hypothetical protein